ncbi:MAG: hypothetical protein WAW37_20620 [Syntrophobacteraceae bacterium]
MKPQSKLAMLVFIIGLLWASTGAAQVAPPLPPAAFDVIGFIQEATLDGTVANTAVNPLPNTSPLAGGTLTVNGIKMLVPNNTIVQMAAASFTWAQLFDPLVSRSIGYAPRRPNHAATNTGLALADPGVTRFPSFEVRAVGNITPHPTNGTPQYIVGLIAPATQQGLNAGFGIINYIDYTGAVLGMPGRFRVGGILNDPTTGAILEINDPVGRWGAVHSPDPRLTSDTGSPTVAAANGFPVGIPRVAPQLLAGGGLDPTFVGDPERPYTNRPLNGDPVFPIDPFLALGAPLKTFNMPAAGTPGFLTDPTKQIPLMVGDAIDYQGTLMKIDPRAAAPNTPANMFISVHTLGADLGVFTEPGVQPCYLTIEAFLVPTAEVRNQPQSFGGSPPTPIPLENGTAIHIVGFTTDTSQLIDIYAIDVDPLSGAETERLITTVLPETIGPGLVRGRFRFQASRSTGTAPATREYIAKSRTGQMANVANGLTSGQYRLPCFDFLFAEHTVFGAPTVPNAFNMMPFLALGSGPLGGTGPVVSRLDPWPGP